MSVVLLLLLGSGLDESALERILAPDPDLMIEAEPFDAATDCEDFARLRLWQEQSQEPESRGFFGTVLDHAWLVVKTLGLDVAYLVTSPLRYNKDAIVPTLGIIAILGGAAAIDEPFQRWVQRRRTKGWDRFFDSIEGVNNAPLLEYALIAGGGVAYVAGWDDQILEMGLTAYEARALLEPTTSWMKSFVGRKRPNESDDAFRFHFMGGDTSFPSGHVFNVAPTLIIMTRYIDRWWFDVIAWTFIALKSLQRVEGNNHWLSDTVGSGVVSWLVGNALVDRHKNPNLRLLPWTGDDESGGGCLGLEFTLRR